VLIVEAQPRSRAVVRAVRLTTPDTLRTVRGTITTSKQPPSRTATRGCGCSCRRRRAAGLAEEVRTLLPRAVAVRVEALDALDDAGSRISTRIGRAPNELFDEFLTERGIHDQRLVTLFQELLDDASHEVHA